MPDRPTPRDEHQLSIYEHILRQLPSEGPGLQSGGEVLPDEPEPEPGSAVVRMAPGLLDEILEPGAVAVREGTAATALRLIEASLRDPSSPERFEALVEHLRVDQLVGFIDPLVAKVASAAVPKPALRDLALRLATSSSDRTPVKVGIALLALCAREEDREVLLTLGRHEEFTHYVGVTLAGAYVDSERLLWDLAKVVQRWGRVNLARQLAHTDDPEIKTWMFWAAGEAYPVMGELAFIAARSGELVRQMRAEEIDDEHCRCAGEIIAALIEERHHRDARDIDDYADGPEAIQLFVSHVSKRAEGPELFRAIATIIDFLEIRGSVYYPCLDDCKHYRRPLVGWTDEERARTATFARWVLLRPAWRRLAEDQLRSPDPWDFQRGEYAARWLGVETMPTLLDRLRKFPDDEGSWLTATRIADEEQWSQLLEVALEQVQRHHTPGLGGFPWGLPLLQEMERFPGTGWALFRTALQSPVASERNFGLCGLRTYATEDWPHEGEALVRAIARSDPDDAVRQWAAEILSERAISR